jgi:hypothetical protein
VPELFRVTQLIEDFRRLWLSEAVYAVCRSTLQRCKRHVLHAVLISVEPYASWCGIMAWMQERGDAWWLGAEVSPFLRGLTSAHPGMCQDTRSCSCKGIALHRLFALCCTI